MKTNKEVIQDFRNYGLITIPKGTRVSHETALGIDKNYHFVDEFDWIEEKTSFFYQDAVHYGININSEDVEKEEE